MSNISYEHCEDKIKVYLDGKRVGEIRQVPNGYQYFCTNGTAGYVYSTANAVKKSLEGIALEA